MSQSQNSPRDPHFRPADPALLRIWDDLQRWQTDFCFPHELCAYYGSESWLQARDVLDIGTGNGYYLAKIADLFPDKRYRGIDSLPELVDIARRDHSSSPIEFDELSLQGASGAYDVVLMRLLVQHLPEPRQALDHAASLVRPGGGALVIDARDSVRFFHPRLPEFVTFFTAFREHEAGRGRNRDVADELERYLADSGLWRLGDKWEVIIPSSLPGNLAAFRRTYLRVLDMLETAGEMQFPFRDVRAALERWCECVNAYTQVGLVLYRLDRR